METIQKQILETAKEFTTDQSWPWIEPVKILLQLTPSGEKHLASAN